MSESMADLAIGLSLVTERHKGIQDYSYQGADVAAPERDSRWRRYLAAGLLALARRMAPTAYAERLTPAARPVSEQKWQESLSASASGATMAAR